MNDSEERPMPADDLDARLAGYLSWQGDQVRGVPTAHEVAVRIAGGRVRPRVGVRPALAWAALALALLLAGLAVFFAGDRNPIAVVAPSPSTGASQDDRSSVRPPTPTLTPTPRPALGAGPCGTGRVEIRAATTGELPADAAAIDVPSGGRIAMALENDTADGGTVVIAGPDDLEPRVVATFTGEELRSPGAVQVVAWSPDGSLLLVWAGIESLEEQSHCGNLWTVATDGSAVARVTDNAPGDVADTSAFAPSGSAIAYAQGEVLHVVRAEGDEIVVPFGPCLNGPWPLQWSPDETRMLLMCGGENAFRIIDLEKATHRRLTLPAAVLGAVWTGDGTSLVAAMGDQVPGLRGGPLSILDVDVASGRYTVRLPSQGSTEWVLWMPSLSPDGRWLLALGGGDVETGLPYYPTYVVDTATGGTRIAPFPLLMDFAENAHVNRPTAIWLDGNDRVLTEDGLALYEVALPGLSRTLVGSVPAQDFAWFDLPR